MTPQEICNLLINLDKNEGRSKFDQGWKLYKNHRLRGLQAEKRTPLSKSDRNRLYANQNGCCARCKESFPIKAMTDDHITPISQGGSNKFWNRRLVCKSCNSSKGAKSLIEDSKVTGETVIDQIS